MERSRVPSNPGSLQRNLIPIPSGNESLAKPGAVETRDSGLM
jgi:hypothetical protein